MVVLCFSQVRVGQLTYHVGFLRYLPSEGDPPPECQRGIFCQLGILVAVISAGVVLPLIVAVAVGLVCYMRRKKGPHSAGSQQQPNHHRNGNRPDGK